MDISNKIAGAAFALTLLPGATIAATSTTTFNGEFWDASAALFSIGDALAVIDAGSATGTFDSTAIDYPNGAADVISNSTSLSTFLGVDAASLVGTDATSLTRSVFRFTGFLDLAAGDQLFSVGSDDGFRLTIDGVEISAASNRSFSFSDATTDAGTGITAFELIYWENAVVTGVEFYVDGALAVAAGAPPATVPLPAGFPLALLGLGALGLVTRRGRAA